MNKYFLFIVFLLLEISGHSQTRFGPEIDNHFFDVKTSKSGLLYAGIDNIVDFKLPPEYEHKSVFLRINNGSLFHDTMLVIIPSLPGSARIELFLIENDSSKLIGHKLFTVEPVPKPTLKLDSLLVFPNSQISKSFLSDCKKVTIFVSNDIIGANNWFSVKEFTVGYEYGGYFVSEENNGSNISDETRDFIKDIPVNRFVSMNTIIMSTSDIKMNLPVTRFWLY